MNHRAYKCKLFSKCLKHAAIAVMTALFAIALESCHRDIPCLPDEDKFQEAPLFFRTVLESYANKDTIKFRSESGTVHTFYKQHGLDSGYFVLSEQVENCNSVLRTHKRYYGYSFKSETYPTGLNYRVLRALNDPSVIRFEIAINKQLFATSADLEYQNPMYINNLVIDSCVYDSVFKIHRDWISTEPFL